MAITATVKVEGLSALVEAFRELPKATGKNVMKRVLTARAKPIAEDAKALCPIYDGTVRIIKSKRGKEIRLVPGALKKSIKISTKLSRSQQRKAKKETKEYVEIYIGPGPLPQAHLVEFGGEHNTPQPYMRPAWDKNKGALLNNLRDDLWDEIRKAAERLARKAAKKV